MYARFVEKNGIQITYCFKLLILSRTLLSDSKRNPHLIGIWFIRGMVWFRRRLHQLWHVSYFWVWCSFVWLFILEAKKQRIANLSRSVCITNKWEVFMMVNHQEIIVWVYLLVKIIISIMWDSFNLSLIFYSLPTPDYNIIMKYSFYQLSNIHHLLNFLSSFSSESFYKGRHRLIYAMISMHYNSKRQTNKIAKFHHQMLLWK